MTVRVPALKVQDIRVRYSGVTAVNGVSLEATRGQVVALIGPNGAGKTTLFDAVSGVRRPDAGRVLLDGQDITKASATRKARLGLRRTFQRQQVFGGMCVEDNLLCASEWHGGGGGIVGDLLALPARRHREAERRELLDNILESCGLTKLRRVSAGALTIGQARMLELGRALVDDPKVLLLDEPTSGLGERDVERLTQIINDVKTKLSQAVVLVEHDITFVMRHADQIVAMVRGEVVSTGTPDEVRQNPTVRDAYLT